MSHAVEVLGVGRVDPTLVGNFYGQDAQFGSEAGGKAADTAFLQRCSDRIDKSSCLQGFAFPQFGVGRR